MKLQYKLLLISLILFLNCTYSQEVEKSIFNIQTGVLGFWANNELRLANHWTLHSEIGLDGSITTKEISGGEFPVFLPVISVEPRYFYNLPKRQSNNKDIYHNSGNFFSLSMKWYPNWFSLSQKENTRIGDDIFVIPTWGIKRNINWNFNYELGGGVGIGIPASTKQAGAIIRPVYNILLRVGYKFY
ncbi:hypothetical protein [Maribacter sp. 1_MG-2023]|uniref:hypothetical protein n=1 Tax=Maribacter sp. 1_MG-2023 TaxID=3062677 RepID=UPI0026E2E1B0|nr:hypothetical protein [Maribacter sp. 1_MG-2023]MDO6470118.1 hypothetical protein [Maribacter sp. 1_MG-2023]